MLNVLANDGERTFSVWTLFEYVSFEISYLDIMKLYIVLYTGTLLFLKNSCVDESRNIPYSMAVCLLRSSAELIGVIIRSTVRNAAKLAV